MNNMSKMPSSNPLHLDANKMFKTLNKVPNTDLDMGLKYVNRNTCYVIRSNHEHKLINIIQYFFHLIQIVQLTVVDFIYSQMTNQRFPFALLRTLVSMVKKSALAR